MLSSFLNVSYRRVGGLRFLRIGRLQLSWCVCAAYRDLNIPRQPAIADRASQFRLSIDGELVLGYLDERGTM